MSEPTTIKAERLGFEPGITFHDFARMNDAELSGMMSDRGPFDVEIVVAVGPPNRDHKRLVVATCGELEHRDRFDCDNAFCREKFWRASLDRLRLRDRPELHHEIENAILRQATANADDDNPQPSLEFVAVRRKTG